MDELNIRTTWQEGYKLIEDLTAGLSPQELALALDYALTLRTKDSSPSPEVQRE